MPARGIFSSLSRLFCMFSVYNILKEVLLQFVYMTKKISAQYGYITRNPARKNLAGFILGGRWDSNPRHSEPQSDALTN